MDYIAVNQHLIDLTEKYKDLDVRADKSDYLRLLITARLVTRGVIEAYLHTTSDIRSLERKHKLMQNNNIFFPILEKQIKYLSDTRKTLHESIVACGSMIFNALDGWQESGATLKELCNLCNANYEKTHDMIEKYDADKRFSSIVFIFNLDYPNTSGDFIELETDAPLTHAIKEFMLDKMLHDPIAQQASHMAFEECFPEIMEKAIYQHTDEDGTNFYTDKTGEPLDLSEMD